MSMAIAVAIPMIIFMEPYTGWAELLKVSEFSRFFLENQAERRKSDFCFPWKCRLLLFGTSLTV